MISQAMATTEEFSFPTTACGIDSPPLWSLSPAASPDVFLDRKAKECSTREVEEEEEGDKEDCFPDRPDKHQEILKSGKSWFRQKRSKKTWKEENSLSSQPYLPAAFL